MQENVAIEHAAAVSVAGTERTARLVYILYLTGVVFAPAGIVGVIIAYLNLNGAPFWLQSHYCFQIRTFWIGSLLLLPGILTTVLLVGYPILLCWAIWLVLRCIMGMKALELRQAHSNPTGWMC